MKIKSICNADIKRLKRSGFGSSDSFAFCFVVRIFFWKSSGNWGRKRCCKSYPLLPYRNLVILSWIHSHRRFRLNFTFSIFLRKIAVIDRQKYRAYKIWIDWILMKKQLKIKMVWSGGGKKIAVWLLNVVRRDDKPEVRNFWWDFFFLCN